MYEQVQLHTHNLHKLSRPPNMSFYRAKLSNYHMRENVCTAAILAGKFIQTQETAKTAALVAFVSMKSQAKCTESCNYTEWGAIRWIRASPFKSHFAPFIMLRAINRDSVGCPGKPL